MSTPRPEYRDIAPASREKQLPETSGDGNAEDPKGEAAPAEPEPAPEPGQEKQPLEQRTSVTQEPYTSDPGALYTPRSAPNFSLTLS